MPYSGVLSGYLLYGMLQGPLGVLKRIPCGAIVGALRPPTSALRLIGGGTHGVLYGAPNYCLRMSCAISAKAALSCSDSSVRIART
jgi:hypothetical protein